MLFMVFLVIIVSLCTLVIPLADVSGRLAYSSTCFLAVMAYRYTLDAMLPRKDYFTLADKYVDFCLWPSSGDCAANGDTTVHGWHC